MKLPNYVYTTKRGSLAIDTSHPEFKKWFREKIEELSKYKIVDGKLVEDKGSNK